MAKPLAVHQLQLRVQTLEEQVGQLFPLLQEVQLLKERFEELSTRKLEADKIIEELTVGNKSEQLALLKSRLEDKERILQDKEEELSMIRKKLEEEQHLRQDFEKRCKELTEQSVKNQQTARAEVVTPKCPQLEQFLKLLSVSDKEKAEAAARSGYSAGLQLLTNSGIDVDTKYSRGCTLLHFSAESGHTDTVNILVKSGAHMNAKCDDGSSPLHLAAEKGQLDVSKALIGARAQVNLIGGAKCDTALHRAARHGHPELCELLLRFGAQANVCDSWQNTPLYWAAREGHLEACRVLIRYGAQVNVCNKEQNTPLHKAAFHGHISVVQFLLEHGADATMKNTSGNTALDDANKNERTEVAVYLREASQRGRKPKW